MSVAVENRRVIEEEKLGWTENQCRVSFLRVEQSCDLDVDAKSNCRSAHNWALPCVFLANYIMEKSSSVL